MPRLGNILSDSDELSISTSDGDIHIDYYPSRVTQKMASQFKKFGRLASSESANDEELQDALMNVYGLLLQLIKSWDLEDEIPCGKCEACKSGNGEDCQSKELGIFPLKAERMDELPVWLIVEITQRLVGPNSKAPQKKQKN
jgi:hypothetical protein